MKPISVVVCLLVSLAAHALPPIVPRPQPPPTCEPPRTLKFECFSGGQCGYRCEMPPRPIAQKGHLKARWMPTHVVYSVPGRGSSLRYREGDVVGTTMALSHGESGKTEAKLALRGGFLGSGTGIDIWSGYDWGTTRAEATDISVGRSEAYEKRGWLDGVSHDNDEVWFLASPTLLVLITPESYYGPETVEWGFEPDSTRWGTPYFLTVGELRGVHPIEEGVRQFLNFHGISEADFPKMLAAHPFAAAPHQPNQWMDPARWELVGTYAYKPPDSPEQPTSPQVLELTRSQAESTTYSSESKFKVGFAVEGSLAFLDLAKSTFRFSEEVTFHSSSSNRTSSVNSVSNTLTVGQPAFGYGGPTVLRCYTDRMWKTFFCGLDWW